MKQFMFYVLIASLFFSGVQSFSQNLKGSTSALGGYENYDFNASKGRQRISDISELNKDVFVRGYSFSMPSVYRAGFLRLQNDADLKLEVQRFLVYPNPYSQSLKYVTRSFDEESSRGVHKAFLGFSLNKDAHFELLIYNMLGRLIYKRHFDAGSRWSRKGYNRIALNHILGDRKLSTGIYFAYMVQDDRVLAKTKFGVKP